MTKNCQPKYNPWLHYFALLTAISTFLLLGLGGLVTSHEAGMSVPDWPTTYGYNMFLFPISKWVGGIKYEHSHRLLASTVGFFTVALAVWFWISDPRRWMRRLGGLAVLLVIAQGVLGGLRVRWNNPELGVIHGTVGQLFFILVCALVLFTSRWWVSLTAEKKLVLVPDGLRFLVVSTTILIFVQLMLGTTMRGQHAGLAIPDFPLAYGQLWPDTSDTSIAKYNAERVEVVTETPITAFQIMLQMAHRMVALAILVAVASCAWQAWRQLGGRDALAKVAMGWFLLILTQIGLGIATVLTNKAADIATLHVMTGALSLVTGALWCIIAFRRSGSWSKIAPAVTKSDMVGVRVALAGNK
jgi:cytochrome c oxidase assembly protein subunit 15